MTVRLQGSAPPPCHRPVLLESLPHSMSLKFTTAPTSQVRKSSSTPRESNSPLKSRTARSGIRKPQDARSRLPDTGRIVTLRRKPITSVLMAMEIALETMFDPIPTSGMHSTKIASVHASRVALAPVVTIAHVQALMDNPTKMDRNLASLAAKGQVRRIVVPSRGMLGGGEEVLITWENLEKLIMNVEGLAEDGRKDFLDYLQANPLAKKIPRILLPADANVCLIRAGFLSIPASTVAAGPETIYKSADAASKASLMATSIAAPTGSLAASGGTAPVYHHGGSGGGIGPSVADEEETEEIYHLTVPGMGPFLRLLLESRTHMISLLGKSHGAEAPQTLLEERWDGGISTHGRSGLNLPVISKTRKWKYYHGLRSQWVLAECIGAGMLELFDTGSVGNGLRATGKRA